MEIDEPEEEPSLTDVIPPEIMVEILRFVFADEKELRRATVPFVSRAWYFSTLEYLANIGQQLEPSQKLLNLRHVAVFRSINWKILSSLRPKVLMELMKEIKENVGESIPNVPIFLLKTKEESSSLIGESRGRFDLMLGIDSSPDDYEFIVKFFPNYRLSFTLSGLNIVGDPKLKFLIDDEFRAEFFTTDFDSKKIIVQEYDVALHIAKVPLRPFGPKSLITRFFENVIRVAKGGKMIIGFEDLLPRMLIVSTRAKGITLNPGMKIEKEEYVYSLGEEGVFIALGSAFFKNAKGIFRESMEEADIIFVRGLSKGMQNLREYALFEFAPEESGLEKVFLFEQTTNAYLFPTVEDAKSAIPYDRVFFSNEIPQEELEKLFMMQKKDMPGKAPGKAKRKGGEIYEF